MFYEIIHGIYISDVDTSNDINLYNRYNITIAMNCTQTGNFVNLDIKKTRIPLSSDMNVHTDVDLLRRNMTKIIDYIYNNFIDHNILITCYDGLTISPLIVAFFLNKYGNIPLHEVKSVLKSKNSDIRIDYDLNRFI